MTRDEILGEIVGEMILGAQRPLTQAEYFAQAAKLQAAPGQSLNAPAASSRSYYDPANPSLTSAPAFGPSAPAGSTTDAGGRTVVPVAEAPSFGPELPPGWGVNAQGLSVPLPQAVAAAQQQGMWPMPPTSQSKATEDKTTLYVALGAGALALVALVALVAKK